jgi:dsDNA-specific endonuclease/ATPase MutS2
MSCNLFRYQIPIIMKKIDLHGYQLEEALIIVEKEIGKIRIKGIEDDLLVITGRGVIRIKLIEYLENNEIDHNFEWGNDGAIHIRVD